MPKTIDDATFEATIRRPWYYPGVHEAPNDWPADDYEAALASSEPMRPDPEDVEEQSRGVEGLGFMLAGCTLAGVAAGAALANLWPAIVAWGMR